MITQETFNSVVKENMEEFEMGKEEAIKEAKQQFSLPTKRKKTTELRHNHKRFCPLFASAIV